jgi:hypothetical protein
MGIAIAVKVLAHCSLLFCNRPLTRLLVKHRANDCYLDGIPASRMTGFGPKPETTNEYFVRGAAGGGRLLSGSRMRA